uniref:Protein kinase domain-containing protein n=1 Tax=Rhabditophanes sp. KR3021 TaxID=114890 RepID=A0AC35U6P9_9BILA
MSTTPKDDKKASQAVLKRTDSKDLSNIYSTSRASTNTPTSMTRKASNPAMDCAPSRVSKTIIRPNMPARQISLASPTSGGDSTASPTDSNSSKPKSSITSNSSFSPLAVAKHKQDKNDLYANDKSSSQDDAKSRHPSFSRTVSTQSLAVGSNESQKIQTTYQTILSLYANDPSYQKEVALGKRIGMYRLGKELGVGNFSKVKLGVHVLTKVKVAIKIMEKSKMDQKAQRLLAREIECMEVLHHPNVIRLFECVETLSKTFLIMEYAGCGELYSYVHQKGKLNEEAAKPIFAQLISALAHLHSKKIVHRDIKAENVIFSDPGWIKLADFGFSCIHKDDGMLSTFCGSPPYAAPELYKDPDAASNDYYGPAVDIWALGCLLYFMLVGMTPFRGDTVNDLKQMVLKCNYHMPEYISHFAQNVISRMLTLDATKRMTILEIKRTYWLNESKFPDSYIQCSIDPDEKELKTSSVARKLWETLHEYGITEDMLREAADKGARNAIIGTYRIVLYLSQSIEATKERIKIRDHMVLQAERKKGPPRKPTKQSKICAIC